MVSGTISLFYSKFFSPFLHSTGSLSVSREYLALPDGPGRFMQNSSCSALLRIPLGFSWLRIPGYHRLWRNFPDASTHQLSSHNVVLQPQLCRNIIGLGYCAFARHYLRNHYLFSFPTGTKMFQFPVLASCISRIISLQDIGLSHSEISGSKVICTYPKLIAAYHVLHRLREPRHPPCALAYFLLTGSQINYLHNWTYGSIYTFSLITILTFLVLYHHVKDRLF